MSVLWRVEWRYASCACVRDFERRPALPSRTSDRVSCSSVAGRAHGYRHFSWSRRSPAFGNRRDNGWHLVRWLFGARLQSQHLRRCGYVTQPRSTSPAVGHSRGACGGSTPVRRTADGLMVDHVLCRPTSAVFSSPSRRIGSSLTDALEAAKASPAPGDHLPIERSGRF